jgi:hypothetical protein
MTIAKKLTKILKEEFKCDLVFAITHMSNSEDMTLQNEAIGVDLSSVCYFFNLISSWWT